MKTITLALLLLSCAAHAKLAPTSLDSLIKDAEVILEAAPVKIERSEGPQAGHATLKVLRVHFGTFDGKELKVGWSQEAHDQPINDINKDYLLFLKKGKDGQYTAAQYGRSYWPFTSQITDPSKTDLDNPARAVKYTHPISMVQLSPAQKKKLLSKRPGEKDFEIAIKNLKAILQK